VKVEQYMTSDVITANPRDGLRQTFYRMRERNIRHMPVVGDGDRVIGIISDRDLRRPDWIDDEENVAHYYLLDNEHKVENSMTREPRVVAPDAEIQQAVELILELRIGALPVVNDAGTLVGMISAIDLLKAFQDVA